MEIPVILLKLAGLFIVEAILLVFIKVYRYRLKIPSVRQVCEDEIPYYIKDFLNQCSQRFFKLDFLLSHYICFEGLFIDGNPAEQGIVLLNKNKSTFAIIKMGNLIYEKNIYNVEFATYFQDNKKLLTVNEKKSFIIGKLPDTILNDSNTATIVQQWYSHINRLDRIKDSSIPVIPDCALLNTIENNKAKKYIDSLLNDNYIKTIGNGLYRLKLLPSLIYTLKVLGGLIKQLLSEKEKSSLPNEFIPVTAEILLAQFKESIQCTSGKKKFPGNKILLLTGNLILLAIAGVLFSMNIIYIGIIVIVFLEFGYYLERRMI